MATFVVRSWFVRVRSGAQSGRRSGSMMRIARTEENGSRTSRRIDSWALLVRAQYGRSAVRAETCVSARVSAIKRRGAITAREGVGEGGGGRSLVHLWRKPALEPVRADAVKCTQMGARGPRVMHANGGGWAAIRGSIHRCPPAQRIVNHSHKQSSGRRHAAERRLPPSRLALIPALKIDLRLDRDTGRGSRPALSERATIGRGTCSSIFRCGPGPARALAKSQAARPFSRFGLRNSQGRVVTVGSCAPNPHPLVSLLLGSRSGGVWHRSQTSRNGFDTRLTRWP